MISIIIIIIIIIISISISIIIIIIIIITNIITIIITKMLPVKGNCFWGRAAGTWRGLAGFGRGNLPWAVPQGHAADWLHERQLV